ncbi:MAG: ribonucleotide-diphosphate reductase subunit beta [Candidatus Pacebacteria bacterium]|nr:ribonucleotide-diphosphate reductase subunit beta [Candidatus Paceibacterota bacterium]
MQITSIRKRNNTIEDFNAKKITAAIHKAMVAMHSSDAEAEAQRVSSIVTKQLQDTYAETCTANTAPDAAQCPTVEEIQDVVEAVLMDSGHHEVAKAYIIYRQKHAELRKRDLFKKRMELKPYEYPELYAYVSAIRHSYWIHTEFNFTSDVQDFNVNVSASEQNAIRNAMLAIAQIEVAVKTFWGDIYKKIPKPEVGAVGATFAESEVRHTDAYAHLLEILGLNHEFETIRDIPALMQRVNYLDAAIKNARSEDAREYSQSILLFSLFIEHVSLFSQFLIIMSFNKYKNVFKGISNAVEATSKEEQIHGLFGIDLINIIKAEHPEWFDEAFEASIVTLCQEAFTAEKAVVEWILEKGELDFMPKNVVLEFIKQRFNTALESIGIQKIFTVDDELVRQSDWFYDEVIATKHGDFFNKKSINYSKKSRSITSDDLF